MKDIIFNKLQDLKSLYISIENLKNEINQLNNSNVMECAEFCTGDKVEIYVDAKLIATGIVGKIKSFLSTDFFDLKDTDEGIKERISCIRYEIFAIKKDGTKSEKHIFPNHYYFQNGGRFSDGTTIKKIL
jgi:hypothetical protein